MLKNFNKEKAEARIEKEKQIIKLKNEYDKTIEEHKGLEAREPSYELFKTFFLKSNPECTEEDLNFVLKKKKGVCYIDFGKLTSYDYNMPSGDCIGSTLLEKRKFTNHPIISYIKSGRKFHKVYETLPTTIIGAIPVGEDEYVLVTRRKLTVTKIISPFIFVIMFIQILKSFS